MALDTVRKFKREVVACAKKDVNHCCMIQLRKEWRERLQEVGKECTCWASWWKTEVTWK